MGNFTGIQSNYYNNQTGFNSPLNSSYTPSPYAGVQYNPNMFNNGAASPMPGVDVGGMNIGGMDTASMGQPQTPTGQGAVNAMGVMTAGLGAIGTGMNISQDYKSTSQFDVDSYLPNQTYNPRSAVPVYQETATPEEISQGTGERAALNYAGQGMSTGASLGALAGPGGAVIGGAVGALGGALLGIGKGREADKKRAEFERKQAQQKEEYGKALNRYYSIQNTQRMQGARDMMTAQRGTNLNPYFTANIYGF